MTISIDDLPRSAAVASLRLRDELLAILGHDLVAMWLHGGTTFADRPTRPGDLDICVVLSGAVPAERSPRRWRTNPASRPSRIEAAERTIAHDLGVAFDTTYLLVDDIGKGTPPSSAFDRRHRETSWPVYRAHWLAGQYVPLYGRRPETLVVPPTRAQLRRALDRELEHLERHVQEGDAGDPYEATYGILNGCRVLYTLETGSPVISKRSAGSWGIEHLPERWHPAIQAAHRSYDGVAAGGDDEVLRVAMPPFVGQVRERLPAPASHRIRQPRWS